VEGCLRSRRSLAPRDFSEPVLLGRGLELPIHSARAGTRRRQVAALRATATIAATGFPSSVRSRDEVIDRTWRWTSSRQRRRNFSLWT